MQITAVVSIQIAGLGTAELSRLIGALSPPHVAPVLPTPQPHVAMRADQLENVLRTSAKAIADAVGHTPKRPVTLQPAGPDFISFADLGRLLGLSRAAICIRVKRGSLPKATHSRGNSLGWRAAYIDAVLAKLQAQK